MKKFLCIITAAVIISLVSASIAYATTSTATSNSSTTPAINGYTYTYYSTLSINSSSGAGSSVSVTCSAVPAGYIGSCPRLYKDTALYLSGTWRYNSTSSCTGVTNSVGTGSVSGTYYACGLLEFYNGSTYNSYTSAASPKLTYTASTSSSLNLCDSIINTKSFNIFSDISNNIALMKCSLSISSSNNDLVLKENKNGETYGSGLIANITGKGPDLISAYGIDGTLGYVRSDDLNAKEINNPSEYALQENCARLIPLYDKDGENVLGEFQIQPTTFTAFTTN